ncbi:hypothetical protein [Sulfurirhabdus autotrophica]|uniref:hypothetical protein n=1 Tax=Sulfurirhabdus autotrophica TaxID=1706046 RepID=UPI000F60640A|nr:hypothetical protein [Sulfurirhabdus autotrophica]
MKQTLKNQTKHSSIALTAVAVFSVIGIGTAQAAPTFTSANIVLDRFGNLECTFRETGLTPGGQVRYDCASTSVGVNTQCFLKNKPVGNSKLLVFHNISAAELVNIDVSRSGQVRAGIITQIPESPNNALVCTVPAEVAVTSIRWCDNSLVDLTNTITAANVSELFTNLVTNGSGSVPSCAVLATMPGLPPGE